MATAIGSSEVRKEKPRPVSVEALGGRDVKSAQADQGKETVDFHEHQEADPLSGPAGYHSGVGGKYLGHLCGLHGLYDDHSTGS